MKKTLLIVTGAVLVLILAYLILPGFARVGTAFVEDYRVEGDQITLRMASYSSVGYVGRVKVHQQQGGKLYLDCYAAFGGLNGRIGNNEITVTLDADTTVIGLWRAENGYQIVLEKDEKGQWNRCS